MQQNMLSDKDSKIFEMVFWHELSTDVGGIA